MAYPPETINSCGSPKKLLSHSYEVRPVLAAQYRLTSLRQYALAASNYNALAAGLILEALGHEASAERLLETLFRL